MRVQIDVHGLSEFAAANEARLAAIDESVGLLLAGCAARIERDAKILAPVDTGNLRASISASDTRDGDTRGIEVGPSANYGGFVEDGTSRMRPQPYMGPALDRVSPQFVTGMTAIATGTGGIPTP